ncbi:LA3241 family PerA/PerB upregulated protein [Leptospira yasudae]|uniref:LA3241 family PerA/PerB upregulated protein n=1 Tax=Leptospira yasudae TaxID=2202201 RepID=UPI0010914372|nr:hypothetical protein [Leptospira yasudae]MBW0433866.1 hypothetical protein [Leptospira yasudae]TGM97151.1 hypothetical protein EHR10_15465 [Leptospira yasudae]
MFQKTFNFLNIPLLLLVSLSIIDCKQKGQRPDFDKEILDPKLAAEIQKDRNILKSELKDSYHIDHSSKSVEEALEKALTEIRNSKGNTDDLFQYSCSPNEIRTIYLPNNLDQNNIIANSKIEDAMYLLQIRRMAGIDKVRQNLQGTKGKIKVLPLPKPYNVRKLTNINGYIIKDFDLEVDLKTIHIDEIKLVIEHKNQFKVCTYGT